MGTVVAAIIKGEAVMVADSQTSNSNHGWKITNSTPKGIKQKHFGVVGATGKVKFCDAVLSTFQDAVFGIYFSNMIGWVNTIKYVYQDSIFRKVPDEKDRGSVLIAHDDFGIALIKSYGVPMPIEDKYYAIGTGGRFALGFLDCLCYTGLPLSNTGELEASVIVASNRDLYTNDKVVRIQ